jgi:hypothetical protein
VQPDERSANRSCDANGSGQRFARLARQALAVDNRASERRDVIAQRGERRRIERQQPPAVELETSGADRTRDVDEAVDADGVRIRA